MNKFSRVTQSFFTSMASLVILVFLSTSASALTLGVTPERAEGFRDSQVFLHNGAGESRVASGICRNGFLELRGDNGKQIMTMLAPCLYAAMQAKGANDLTGQVGVQLLEFQGLSFNVSLDSENGSVMYGTGLSILHFNDSFNGQ